MAPDDDYNQQHPIGTDVELKVVLPAVETSFWVFSFSFFFL